MYIALGQSSTCPTFGTNQPSGLSRSCEERIFMNFESPAQCKGNVTGWRFCYYRNYDDDSENHCGNDDEDFEDTSNSREFAALFIVFRRQSATSNNYIPVPGSVREKRIQWRVIKTSRFQCMYENLSTNEYFEIQENDIVGACIKDVGSNDPLLLVGTSSRSNFLTYQWDERDYDDCLLSQYSNVDTTHNDFIIRSTSTLHLYANIGEDINISFYYHNFIVIAILIFFQLLLHLVLLVVTHHQVLLCLLVSVEHI